MKRLVSLGLATAAAVLGMGTFAVAQAPQAVEHSGNVFHVAVCPHDNRPGEARCHAHVVTDANGRVQPNARGASTYYWSAQLRSAYGVSWTGAVTDTPNGPTVAIVDAYGYKNAEADLAIYRQHEGLPPCSTANHCFTKIDQNGGANYPADNSGWAQESALDIQMVSAICPNCRIVLVEANSANFNDLATAEDTAAGLAKIVSNSYGGGEAGSSAYEFHYNHQGVAITVSSGDNGYGVQFPASSPHVTAVGGTSLTLNGDGSYKSETAWSGAGSGCSSTYGQPGFQTTALTGCGYRMVADVSAVADPNTGVAVYAPYGGSSAWLVFGGTSVAAPIIAGVYGVNGGAPYLVGLPYNNPGALHDVTSGSNGRCRNVPVSFCNAVGGYDGPTGLGSPNGPSAF